ncbi:hypothetical protein GN956_G11377 [Arapaima gigas]
MEVISELSNRAIHEYEGLQEECERHKMEEGFKHEMPAGKRTTISGCMERQQKAGDLHSETRNEMDQGSTSLYL